MSEPKTLAAHSRRPPARAGLPPRRRRPHRSPARVPGWRPSPLTGIDEAVIESRRARCAWPAARARRCSTSSTGPRPARRCSTWPARTWTSSKASARPPARPWCPRRPQLLRRHRAARQAHRGGRNQLVIAGLRRHMCVEHHRPRRHRARLHELGRRRRLRHLGSPAALGRRRPGRRGARCALAEIN